MRSFYVSFQVSLVQEPENTDGTFVRSARVVNSVVTVQKLLLVKDNVTDVANPNVSRLVSDLVMTKQCCFFGENFDTFATFQNFFRRYFFVVFRGGSLRFSVFR